MSDFFENCVTGLVLVVIVAVGLAAIVLPIRGISHHYGNLNCHRFGEESSREVRFVDYSFWTWECLTPTSDGKWIPTDRLRDID